MSRFENASLLSTAAGAQYSAANWALPGSRQKTSNAWKEQDSTSPKYFVWTNRHSERVTTTRAFYCHGIKNIDCTNALVTTRGPHYADFTPSDLKDSGTIYLRSS
jgi:hypothetical protein